MYNKKNKQTISFGSVALSTYELSELPIHQTLQTTGGGLDDTNSIKESCTNWLSTFFTAALLVCSYKALLYHDAYTDEKAKYDWISGYHMKMGGQPSALIDRYTADGINPEAFRVLETHTKSELNTLKGYEAANGAPIFGHDEHQLRIDYEWIRGYEAGKNNDRESVPAIKAFYELDTDAPHATRRYSLSNPYHEAVLSGYWQATDTGEPVTPAITHKIHVSGGTKEGFIKFMEKQAENFDQLYKRYKYGAIAFFVLSIFSKKFINGLSI